MKRTFLDLEPIGPDDPISARLDDGRHIAFNATAAQRVCLSFYRQWQVLVIFRSLNDPFGCSMSFAERAGPALPAVRDSSLVSAIT